MDIAMKLPLRAEFDEIVDADGEHVGWASGENTTPDEDAAHAAFLVRCANAYAGLVRALEAIIAAHDDYLAANPHARVETDPLTDRIEEGRAALAAARGETP